LVFSLAAFLATGSRFYVRELVMAFGIGVGSFGGQLFSLLALEQKVPGYIVFPILAIYLTPPTPSSSVLGCGRGLSQDVA
jgi:hypothetical protein